MKEAILDKYYPKERTVFREAILNAMEEYAQARLKARGTKSQETFDEVYELLESRLNTLGPIKAGEAWDICQGNTRVSYGSINVIFREIMKTMVEQGKAQYHGKGKYTILKANEKQCG